MADDKLTHDKLPRPKGKAVPFPKVDSWDEASDYVLSAYHACVDKIDKTKDAEQRLWTSAAQSYIGAFMGLAGLRTLPGDAGLAKFKEQVADANQKADQAAAAAKNS